MRTSQDSADQTRTTVASGADANWPDFPPQSDWGGWVDVWCRDDTGNIDCVPLCLRHHVEDLVTPEGWPKHPGMIPNTPYKVARWFQNVPGQPRPPWAGEGIRPDVMREVWEERQAEKAQAAAPEIEESSFSADLYFIRSEAGPIKIGVSNDVRKRLKGLQTSSPYKLSIACIKRCAAMEEGAYHERFAAHRLHGEWFSPAPEIEAEITTLTEGAAA
ncbi:GIY-YIG nuclease family protein [Sphingomonas sp. SAFR-052]|uniref:GIY-YIG nuclease family protein n=1 Tax=Sphingomonas sp. SAFR-052 TaxID=3436867 RepID=UPI003F7E9067